MMLPELFAPIAPRVAEDAGRVFGARVAAVQPLAYDDRRFSHLLHARVEFADGRMPSGAYVKIYKAAPGDAARMRARVEHDFHSTQRVFDHLSRWSELGAVRPIGCYPDHLAVATEEASGETLLALLEREAAGVPPSSRIAHLDEVMRRVGAWIRAFQELPVPETAPAAADAREYIDIRLARLVGAPAGRFDEADRRRVLDHVDRLAAALGPAGRRQVAVHADLAPGNILVDRDRITVLDFAMTTNGAPLHDLTRLFLQIGLLAVKPQFRPGTIRRLQQSLLRGYDDSLAQEDPLFRMLLLRHHVNHLATLSVSRESFPSSVYSWCVRRHHRRWIARELRSAVAAGAGRA